MSTLMLLAGRLGVGKYKEAQRVLPTEDLENRLSLRRSISAL